MKTSISYLRRMLERGGSTQLGIGPMSQHCVDAVIELANAVQRPLMLIASRRQIECDSLGRGYVNGWSTEEFAAYVRARDAGGWVLLCRDHGGPWQNEREAAACLPLGAAMASAKTSLDADLQAGFDILHLDPSIDVHDPALSEDEIIDRLCELYEHCETTAARLGADVDFEVGAEEQSGEDQNLEALDRLLSTVMDFCTARGFRRPLFVVGQTGTLVKETRNVGTMDDPFRQASRLPAEILVPKVLEMCRAYGVYLKEHNGDYLSNDALSWHPRLGIHAANIAPEFAVSQTKHVLSLCRQFDLKAEAETFLRLAYDSGKWKKWMISDTRATDYDRAVIAGHYVYSTAEFGELFERIRAGCRRHGVDVDESIRSTLKAVMMRYLVFFRIV
jgi:hypothetical protein